MKPTITIITLLILLIAPPVFADTIQIKNNNVSVRTMPGAFYPVVTILNAGATVTILEKGAKWHKVTTPDNKTGWISTNAFNSVDRAIDYGAMAMDNSTRNISKIMVTAAVKGFFENSVKDPNLNRSVLENPWRKYLSPSPYLRFKQETYANRWSQETFQKKNKIVQGGAFRIDENLVAISAFIAAKLAAPGLSSNTDLVTYVNNVAQLIIESTEFYDLPISVHVVRTDDVFANATPIGAIMISEGMLKTIRNESELACLLGHEISHVTLMHGSTELNIRKPKIAAENAFDELGEELGVDDVEMELDELCLQIYEHAVRGRKAEYELEADKRGMVYARRAGYSADGMVTLLARIKTLIPASRNPEDASHWYPRDIEKRIGALEQTIRTTLKPSKYYADFTPRYQQHIR